MNGSVNSFRPETESKAGVFEYALIFFNGCLVTPFSKRVILWMVRSSGEVRNTFWGIVGLKCLIFELGVVISD